MLIDSLVSVLKAIGKDIKTIADSVDKKADSADLSSKRDISNTEFTKSIAVKADDYSGIKLYNTAGGYARLECAPEHNTGIIASIIKRDKNDALKYVLSLPARNGTLATTEQIPELVRHVVDSWHNPANGAYWREWSDGWLEEGGYCPISGTPSIVTVSYHKPFKNPPIMTLTDVTKQDTTGGADVYKTPTTTNFSVILVRNNRQGFYWKAEGDKA